MITKIKNWVKFGVPAIFLLLMLYAVFFMENKGDPEFGAFGKADTFIFLLIMIVVLYLIAGIIVWAIKKTNFLFLSALFSAIVITIILLILIAIG